MARICNKCKTSNPDDAHYCGNCQARLDNKSWKLYDSDEQEKISKNLIRMVGENGRLSNSLLSMRKERDEYKQRVENLEKKIKNKGGSNWGCFFWIILIGIAGYFAYTYFFENKKEIGVYEVDGKYTLGYNSDDLVINEFYDSIDPNPYGHIWLTFDFEKNKIGCIYANDDNIQIHRPIYDHIYLGNNDVAFLLFGHDNYYMTYQGININLNDPYKVILYDNDPNYFSPDNVFPIVNSSGRYQLVNIEGKPVVDEEMLWIDRPCQGVITAEIKAGDETYYKIFDYQGKPLNDIKYPYIHGFSQGVSWAFMPTKDNKKSAYTIINTKGEPINHYFDLPIKDFRAFSNGTNGIGWYLSANDNHWHAVSKDGEEQFDVAADNVGYFSMGVAPVIKNNRLGFVNHKGKTVIDFKYQMPDNTSIFEVYFNKDSLLNVPVRYNNTSGYLKRNGTYQHIYKF